MKNKHTNILVLGASGMLGKTVFIFLKNNYPKSVWGTSRNKKDKRKNLFFLETSSLRTDFNKIVKKIKQIDLVINCIALTKTDDNIENVIEINALFPHQVEKLAEKYGFKLIHVSTDAVFPIVSKRVSERSTPYAQGIYSASKLLGELSGKNSITVRSSFLGSISKNKDSFFQKALKHKDINGFIDQKWSGSTTLQFAKFCYFLTKDKNFDTLRKVSSIYHFVPLSNTTRYEILANLSKIKKGIRIKKKKSLNPITRNLVSQYFDKNFYSSYTTNIQQALLELFQFEKTTKND